MTAIQLTRAQRRQLQSIADRVDRVTQADRRFFERFPHRQHRVRVASQAEIVQQEIIENSKLSWPDGYRPFCVVKNLAPGVRLRLYIVGLEGADTDLNEATARAIYEDGATPKTRQVEAQMCRAVGARAC